MELINQSEVWQSDVNRPFIPITQEGEIVGFGQPELVNRVVAILNDDENVRKALQLACYDLISRSGGSTNQVEQLMQEYLAKAARPKSGARAIALLLQERQDQLDVSDEEFTKFCDSYRLSRQELQRIYAGEEVEVNQLTSLSRILGISVDDLLSVLEGKPE